MVDQTVTFKELTPLENVDIYVYSDEDMETLVDSGQTDALGVWSADFADVTTFYYKTDFGGYHFHTGSFTTAGAALDVEFTLEQRRGTLCLSEDVEFKAGNFAIELTNTEYDNLIEESAGFVCVASRYNWVDNYATINDVAKYLLKDVVSSHAAMSVIAHDMTGFFSRLEVQTMLDVLYSKVVDIINMLRDEKFRTFAIKGTVD